MVTIAQIFLPVKLSCHFSSFFAQLIHLFSGSVGIFHILIQFFPAPAFQPYVTGSKNACDLLTGV